MMRAIQRLLIGGHGLHAEKRHPKRVPKELELLADELSMTPIEVEVVLCHAE